MRGNVPRLLRRAVASSSRKQHGFSTQGAGGPAVGEEGEKLGFVTALGGLVAASAGAIAVFGFGVLGVMGAAKGAAMLLGHSLDAKRPEAGSQDSAQSQSDAELRAELSALRALPRSKDTDARKAAVKKLLLRDA